MAIAGRSYANVPVIVRSTLQDPPVLTTPAPVVTAAAPDRRWFAGTLGTLTVLRSTLQDPPVLTTAAPAVVAAATDRRWFNPSPVTVLASPQAPAAAAAATPGPVIAAGQPAAAMTAVPPVTILRSTLTDPPVLTTPAPAVIASPADRRWFAAAPVTVLSAPQAPPPPPAAATPAPLVITSQPWPKTVQALTVRNTLQDPPALTTGAPVVASAPADRRWFSVPPATVITSAPASAPPPPAPVFPAAPLDLECQLNLFGVWTDVTSYAYQREGTSAPVVITRGRPDETSQAVPATCAWQWNNRDGRFSPRNPLSPYYGQLGRNTPVRWSVPSQTNYLRLEADNSDRAFVADNSTLHVTGSLEVRIGLRLSDWQGCLLAGRIDSTSTGAWGWTLRSDGTMRFFWWDSGNVEHQAVSDVPLPYASGDFALRVTMDATTGTVTWYTSGSVGGAWTQLGDAVTVTGSATSVRAGSDPLRVGWSPGTFGDIGSGASVQLLGRIYEVRVYNGIAGSIAADGIFSAQSAGAASWTDSAGNVWNVAGGAEVSARDYRFHGEMSALPPRWDVTGKDMWVAAQAGGPLRRIGQGTGNVMSAMKRAILLQTGSLAPVAYWPLEDGTSATQFGAAIGPNPLTWTVARPSPAASSVFACSAPLPTLGGAALTGPVQPYSAGGGAAWAVRFLADIPTLPGSGEPVLFQVNLAGGLAAYVIMAVNSSGNVQLIAYDASLNVIADTGLVAWPGGIQQPLWWSIEATPSGSNVQYALVSLAPGASAALSASATSSSAGSAGYVNAVIAAPFGGAWTDTVIGHVQVQSAWASLFSLAGALNAWTGELAATRYARVAAENGYAVRILGSPAYSAAMGPQGQATLQALLTECETADLGQQYEPRQQLSLGYRTLASMCSQPPVLSLSYSSSQPGGVNGSGTDSGLDPTYDDLLTGNDWTVTRGAVSGTQGGTWRSTLNDGSAMSISNPPTGAGDYAKPVTVNVLADAQLPDAAGWRVHVGTVNDERWPSIPVNLARPAMQPLYWNALAVEVGDMLQVSSLPAVVLYDPVKQLAFGMREALGGKHYTQEHNCVPEQPYEVIVLDDPVLGRLDTDGSSLHATAAYPQSSLSVDTGSGFPVWTVSAGDFPFDVNISGMRLTVTNITGSSSPQTFSVTPAVNGVQKTLTAGADVRLWTPTILALT